MPLRKLCKEGHLKEGKVKGNYRQRSFAWNDLMNFFQRRTQSLYPRKILPHRPLNEQRESHRPPNCPSNKSSTSICTFLPRAPAGTVIEAVMREELEALIGAAWGESTPKRKGYRNGTYTRDLVTSSGRLEDIKVPRDREGQFHTQAFDRYCRYEPHIARSD